MKKEVEVVLTVLNQAAEAAYSVQAIDWSGSKGRGRERDTVRLVNALVSVRLPKGRSSSPSINPTVGHVADTKIELYSSI